MNGPGHPMPPGQAKKMGGPGPGPQDHGPQGPGPQGPGPHGPGPR